MYTYMYMHKYIHTYIHRYESVSMLMCMCIFTHNK